ncbi:hypothetical protein [Herbaspirillum sp. ST 5-3]|uniref:hypothetical protein n=1 Tax=Oxalobacteraceae TaxID=75682 RepID=UPI0010A44BFA|nr:hypothetical protein [Herbaspirillum sp. ST 5-3]
MNELNEILTTLSELEKLRTPFVHDYIYLTCSVAQNRIEEDTGRTLREKLNNIFISAFDDIEPRLATRIVALLEDDELPIFFECALKCTTEEFLNSLESVRLKNKLDSELAVKQAAITKRIKL